MDSVVVFHNLDEPKKRTSAGPYFPGTVKQQLNPSPRINFLFHHSLCLMYRSSASNLFTQSSKGKDLFCANAGEFVCSNANK